MHHNYNLTAVEGQRVTLKCNSTQTDPDSTAWWHQKHSSADITEVYLNGQMYNGYRNGFSVDKSAGYNLIINSVATQDTGLYTCALKLGHGDQYITSLSVLGRGSASSYVESSISYLGTNATSTVNSLDSVTSMSPELEMTTWLIVVLTVLFAILLVLFRYRCVHRRPNLCRNADKCSDSNQDERFLIKSNVENLAADGKRGIFRLAADPQQFETFIDTLSGHITPGVDVVVGLGVQGSLVGLLVAMKRRLPFVSIQQPLTLTRRTDDTNSQVGSMDLELDVLRGGSRAALITDQFHDKDEMDAAVDLLRKCNVEFDVTPVSLQSDSLKINGQQHSRSHTSLSVQRESHNPGV